MARSEAFERNAAKLLRLVDQIPTGRCSSYGALGKRIGIVPRYVALIMATAPEVSTTHWHRVVGKDGTIKPGGHRAEQIKRLTSEGFTIERDRIVDIQRHWW